MEFKICRVCLDRTATICVFSKQDDVQYSAKLMKCVNVVITEGDGLPDSICEGCAGDLALSYEFAQRCEASDKALRCLDLLHADAAHDADDTAIKYEHREQSYSPIHQDLSIEQNLQDNDFTDDHCKAEDSIKAETDTNSHTKTYKQINKCFSRRVLPDHLRTRKLRLKTGPLQCELCDRVAPSYSAMELHMRTHTKEKPYSCDLCKKSFAGKYTMKRHIQQHYGFKRDEYSRKKINKYDKRKNRNKLGPFQCPTCGRMMASASAMQNHSRTHTGEKPFPCHLCGAKFKLRGTLKRHLHSSHPELYPHSKYICDHCNKIFHTKSNIIIHLRIHTGAKPYRCPYCGVAFRQISGLIRHKRRHTGERPFACDICGRGFVERGMLTKHQMVHSTEKNYSCHICSKTLKTKESLRVHLNGHSNTKQWVCSICGMSFTLKGNLKTHMQRKHSERSGLCAVCNKEFGDLDAHMRVHTGEKPFSCTLCDQSYASARSLSHHISFKHRDANKYKCAVEACPRSFPSAAMLEFHVLKVHAASTPYVCRHCGRGFLRPSDLSRHLKVNHLDTQTTVKAHFNANTIHAAN